MKNIQLNDQKARVINLIKIYDCIPGFRSEPAVDAILSSEDLHEFFLDPFSPA